MTVESNSSADAGAAHAKYQQALVFINAGGLDHAEQCLNESLLADVSFGPAHNALGKVYFDQRKFYLAAWEFEHAANTMPSRAEPLNNLGLVYETVGYLDEAIAQYSEAVSLCPENAEYLGNRLRAQVRRGDDAGAMRDELQRLVYLDQRPRWSNWARKLLASEAAEIDKPNSIQIPSVGANEIPLEEYQLSYPQ